MVHMLDELLVVSEIAIHASVHDEQAASAPPTQDPQELEQLLRQNCRDLIAASYDQFQTTVLENPFGTVYEVQKQQALAALKEELCAKADAASSAEERQIYLNYARVVHLQFAQKANGLDAVVASYNQNVPEHPHYVAPGKDHDPNETTPPYFLAGLGVPRRHRKKKKRGDGNDTTSSAQSSSTAVPKHSLDVTFTHGTVDGDAAVILPDPDNPYDGLDVVDGPGYVDNSAHSRDAKVREDKVFVEWSERDLPPEDFQDSPTNPGKASGNKVIPPAPTTVSPDDKATEEVPNLGKALKPVIRTPVSLAVNYKVSETLAAEQQRAPDSSFLEKTVYGTLAVVAVATAIVLGYAAFSSSHPNIPPKEQAVASASSPASPVSVASPAPSESPLLAPQPISTYKITYERTTPPAYDAQNPAPWYQIEKADLRNNGKTLDLRLGSHLSMDGRTVRVNWDSDGDGKADRTTYVDSAETLSLSVAGQIIDLGVGFKTEKGFEYHSSVRLDSKKVV